MVSEPMPFSILSILILASQVVVSWELETLRITVRIDTSRWSGDDPYLRQSFRTRVEL